MLGGSSISNNIRKKYLHFPCLRLCSWDQGNIRILTNKLTLEQTLGLNGTGFELQCFILGLGDRMSHRAYLSLFLLWSEDHGPCRAVIGLKRWGVCEALSHAEPWACGPRCWHASTIVRTLLVLSKHEVWGTGAHSPPSLEVGNDRQFWALIPLLVKWSVVCTSKDCME